MFVDCINPLLATFILRWDAMKNKRRFSLKVLFLLFPWNAVIFSFSFSHQIFFLLVITKKNRKSNRLGSEVMFTLEKTFRNTYQREYFQHSQHSKIWSNSLNIKSVCFDSYSYFHLFICCEQHIYSEPKKSVKIETHCLEFVFWCFSTLAHCSSIAIIRSSREKWMHQRNYHQYSL